MSKPRETVTRHFTWTVSGRVRKDLDPATAAKIRAFWEPMPTRGPVATFKIVER